MVEHDFRIGQIITWCGRIWTIVDVAHQGQYQLKLQVANSDVPPIWVTHRGAALVNDD